MAELIVRLIWAAGIMISSLFMKLPPGEWGWKLSLGVSAYAIAAYLLERRDMRNAGVSGILGVFDAGVVAALAAFGGSIDHYGFLVLAPTAYAAARHGANSAAMAPLAASMILAAANLSPEPVGQSMLLVQALGILSVGLLLSLGKTVVTITERIEVPVPTAMAPAPEVIELPPASDTTQYLALRESFRKLRDYAESMERKTKRDRIVSALFDAAHGTGEAIQQRLAHKLRDLTGVEGVSLYTVAQMADQLVVTATSGTLPIGMDTRSFDISGVHTDGLIKRRVDSLVKALRDANGTEQRSATVLIRDRGRLYGAICLVDSNPERIQKAIDLSDTAATTIGSMLREDIDNTNLTQRLKQAELLYTISTVTDGAETPTSLCSRVVREMWDILPLDHLSVHILDESGTIQAARAGATASLTDMIQFPAGPGPEGWAASGCPEVMIFDTSEDTRVDRVQAIKRRIGSFLMLPIQFGDKAFGFVAAATHRNAGIDSAELEALRVITAELTQAIGRIEAPLNRASGIMTPAEFAREVGGAKGCFILIEPVRKEELEGEFGRPAIEMALKTFTRRMKQRLPSAARLCRRSEGDFVVFLPAATQEFARSWANDAVTNASMIGVKTPDGRAKIPLALRAKVSESLEFAEVGMAA